MKLFLLPAILLCIGYSSICQSNLQNITSGYADSLPVIKLKNEPRFNLNIHTGYAFSLGSTFRFYPDNIIAISITQLNTTPPVKEVNYKEDTKGLGDGLRLGIGFSYIINDFINAGIDIDYFQGSISKTRDSSFYSSKKSGNNIRELKYDEQLKISYETSVISFSPNISFKAFVRPKFSIYNKIGAIIIISPSAIQHENTNGKNQTGLNGYYKDSSMIKQKTYKWGIQNPAFGFMGAVGGQVRVREKIRAFAELQYTHIVFKPKNKELTEFNYNGNEKLSTLSQSQKEIIFKKSYASEDTNLNPDMPTVAIYQKIPITYAGLIIGIIYNF